VVKANVAKFALCSSYRVAIGRTMNDELAQIPHRQPRRLPLRSGAVKRSISLPGVLDSHALSRARGRGYSCFSDYIQELIRRDGFVVSASQ